MPTRELRRTLGQYTDSSLHKELIGDSIFLEQNFILENEMIRKIVA